MHLQSLLPIVAFQLAAAIGVAAIAVELPAQDEIRSGPWHTAGKIPDGWVVHNTKNYHVQSQCGLEKAKRLGAHMEIMNVVYRRMFPPGKGGTKLQTIKLFADEDGYRAYSGAPPGAVAYFAWAKREMVCYDTGKWSDEVKEEGPVTGPQSPLERLQRGHSRFMDLMKMDLLGTAAHEGWHQYFDWLVGSRVQLPSWIDEGMGDYFYAAAPKRDEPKRRKPKVELGLPNDGRLWVVQAAVDQDMLVPLEKFVAMLQDDYYANPGLCYAQGWAFCQFLLHGADGKYEKIIPKYVHLITTDSNWRAVTEKAFRGVDFAKMDEEFHAYIAQLQPTQPDPMKEDILDFSDEMPPVEGPPGSEPPAGGPPTESPPVESPPGGPPSDGPRGTTGG